MYKFDKDKLRFVKADKLEENIRRVFIFILGASLVLGFTILFPRKVEVEKVKKVEVVNTIIVPDSSSNAVPPTEFDNFVDALIFVESNGRDSIINPTSGATGCLQLLPIMVKEVNRILTKIGSDQRYTLDDRYSRKKSVEMFHIWRLYHHADHSYEVIARNWNGGTLGYLNPSTLGYWKKVKRRL